MQRPESTCDLLCLAAHTDDAEIALGGTLRLLADRGRRIWVVDLTRGELASNATPDERWAEAERASELLGIAGRLQLGLPDGFLDPHDPEQARAVVAVVRRLRPRWVVTTPAAHRHPDHLALPELASRACFLAGLAALSAPAPAPRDWPVGVWAGAGGDAPDGPWRPEAVLATCPDESAPSLLFDVSGTWDAKLAALACYASQFAREPGRRATFINDPAFLDRVESRGRLWGQRAGVARAEALVTASAPVCGDLPAERWS